MHYQAYNATDEFEPRITPKPATKFHGFAVPSVPEVSLVFDKSGEVKKIKPKSPIASSLDRSKSYAEWKEQNFSQRTYRSYPDSPKTPRQVPCHKDVSPLQQYNFATDIPVHREQTHTPRCINNAKESLEHYKPDTASEGRNIGGHVPHENLNKSSRQKHPVGGRNNEVSKRSDFVRPAMYSPKPQHFPQPELSREKKEEGYFRDNKNMVVHHSEKERAMYGINSMPDQLPLQNSHLNPNMLLKNAFPPMLHPTGYSYPYADITQQPFPSFYPPMYAKHADNNETVRNLLQLVNNQSEQIKSLQTQVDRLLKMQEEGMKERSKCTCTRLGQQNLPLSIDSRDAINSAKVAIPQEQSSGKNMYQDSLGIQNEATCLNEIKDDDDMQMIQSELQARKTLLEQKVSIGVMTSFEFTVQNSPFLMESEEYEKRNLDHNDLINKKNGFIYPDTGEPLRRNKCSFPRMAGVQLENIVEDSESHMSSSHQQSSNFNASCSTKDLHERQNNSQDQKDLETCSGNSNQQSPREYERLMQNLTEVNTGLLRPPKNVQQTSTDNSKKPVNQMSNNPTVNYGTGRQYANHAHAGANDVVQSHAGVQAKDMDKVQYGHNNLTKKHLSKVQSNNGAEESLVLSGGDLKVVERPPTPEPSIHVDMKEYSSDEESEKVKHTSKVGWTFYNNVLGQVNQILQNSHVNDNNERTELKASNNIERNGIENKVLIDTVKNATLEQLRKFGISLSDNPDPKDKDTKKVAFDSSIYPRLDYQANMTQGTSSITETNTSMHMKALALKYLSDEQLADLAMQKQGSTSMKHLLLSNMQGTNMSFATMRYLERYQLLPGKNNNNVQMEDGENVGSPVPPKLEIRPIPPKPNPALQRYPFTQTPRTSCPSKILDISTLKQQPKLL